MRRDLKELETVLGHNFSDQELLQQALRHRSSGTPHNERLEFLGDAVLGFVISAELYQRQSEAKEGALSRLRSLLVNRETLAELGIKLDLPEYLELGPGEQRNKCAERQSIIADAVEALFGAIYLDAGLEKAQICILRLYAEIVTDLAELLPAKDAKTELQEWLQARGLPLPVYSVEMQGQAHALTFQVECRVEGLQYVTSGSSTSRRKAEQAAAKAYLEYLNE